MFRFVGLCFGMLVRFFRERRSLLLENLALRQQLVVRLSTWEGHWFSGRSLMDKSGQAITACSPELWGIDSKAARPTTLRLTALRPTYNLPEPRQIEGNQQVLIKWG